MIHPEHLFGRGLELLSDVEQLELIRLGEPPVICKTTSIVVVVCDGERVQVGGETWTSSLCSSWCRGGKRYQVLGETASQFCLSYLQVRTSEFKPAPSDDRPFSAEAGTAEVVSQEGEIFAFLQVSTLIRVVEFGGVCNCKGTLGKQLWL